MEHWQPWQRMVLLGIFSAIVWFVAQRAISAIYGQATNSMANSTFGAADAGSRVLLWLGLAVVWVTGSWFIIRSGRQDRT